MAEMFAIGEKMSELGIPIPPNFDRSTTCTPKCQAGFIRFVVQPLYKTAAHHFFPRATPILNALENNAKYWEAKAETDPDFVFPPPELDIQFRTDHAVATSPKLTVKTKQGSKRAKKT